MRRPSFITPQSATTTACAPADTVSGTLPREVVNIRPADGAAAKQGFSYFQGICSQNAGASGLCLYKIVIPPGGAAEAHYHKAHETAVYLLEGRVQTFFGDSLEKSVTSEPGDFVYIPAGMPHKPVNLSSTEAAVAIVARTDPNEQEGIIPLPELDRRFAG